MMRALALFSGGLDSMIAIKLMADQGIEVMALHMDIGFGSRSDISHILKERATIAGGDFANIDVREEYIQKILFNPKYGYGKHFNPCIDCHGYMFRIAKRLLEKYDAKFIVTGEVLGQRPMSQRSDAMRSVKKLALDEEDLILRPLSAKLMDETTAEKQGWVDREKLLDISGRGRDRQLTLATEYGWENYQSPGGGCLLTDPRFTKKLREFLKYESLHVEDIDILKNGRHMRLPDGAKLVVGRDENENDLLERCVNDHYIKVKAQIIPGPSSLLSRNASASEKALSAKIILSFSKTKTDKIYKVDIGEEIFEASPFASRKDAHEYLVL